MSTTDSVSSVALNGRNAEISPRVTSAVSTGTISAAAWRALSFSALAARFAALSVGLPLSPPFLAAGAVPGAVVVVAAAAALAGGAGSRLQPESKNPARIPVTKALPKGTAPRRETKDDTI